MNKLINRKKYIVVIALSLALCWMVAKLVPLLSQKIEIDRMVEEDHYLELTSRNLQSEWNCLPDTIAAREDFILKLMKRLNPDEYKQFMRGEEWLAEYRSKELSGLLTVDERRKAHLSLTPFDSAGVLYYFFPWTINSSVAANGSSKSLRVESCALDATASCPTSQRFDTDEKHEMMNLLYQKQGLRWQVNNRQWSELVKAEYRLLEDKKMQMSELEDLAKSDGLLLYEARQNVSKMSADNVPFSDEEKYIQREYKRLRCK